MTASSLLLTTTPKTKTKAKKQTTRTGTEPQKWRSPGGLSARKQRGENKGKGTGNKKLNWQVQNRRGGVKSSTGNGKAKELICTTHGHELRGGMLVGRWMHGGGG